MSRGGLLPKTERENGGSVGKRLELPISLFLLKCFKMDASLNEIHIPRKNAPAPPLSSRKTFFPQFRDLSVATQVSYDPVWGVTAHSWRTANVTLSNTALG